MHRHPILISGTYARVGNSNAAIKDHRLVGRDLLFRGGYAGTLPALPFDGNRDFGAGFPLH